MHRIFVGVMLLAALLSCQALAEDAPRAEVFGGFQYFRANSGINESGFDNFNLNGWNASLNGFFNKYVGITADFSGAYGNPQFGGIPIDTKLHTFMFGPVLRLPNPTHLTPFVHALGGGAHISGDVEGSSASETDAAWAVGGGVDLDFSRILAFRLGQFDYLQTRVGDTGQNNFRFSTGIVLKF
jgi:opacity protein-like surface antigen